MSQGSLSYRAGPGWGSASIIKFLMVLFLALIGLAGALQMEAPAVSAQDACPPGYTEYPTGFGDSVCVPGGGSSFASEIVNFKPGAYVEPEPGCVFNDDPAAALGPPDAGQGANGKDVSIGGGGVLIVSFPSFLTGSGDSSPDIFVWETGPAAEVYDVAVSEDNETWTTVGRADGQTQGSQGFDIDHAGFGPDSRLKYVKITDIQKLCRPAVREWLCALRCGYRRHRNPDAGSVRRGDPRQDQ